MWLTTTNGVTTHVKATPIDLSYDAWFWSKDLDKLYKVVEDYVFWQQDTPKVSLLYNDLWELTPDIHFGDIVDESTVAEQFQQGLIYVYRMPITVDGWILKGEAFNTISKIKVTFYDMDDVTNFTEIIVEDSDQDTDLANALKFFEKSTYDIHAIDLVTNSISIRGDFVSDFSVGKIFQIWNSANNGVYTVSSEGASYVITSEGGLTTVAVDETLLSMIAAGTIYMG